MKCIACGSTALIEGTVNWSETEPVKFILGGESLLRRIFGMGGRPVRAFGCTHCGHLQLVVDFKEDDLERYQKFEGPQPNLLERLNTDEE